MGVCVADGMGLGIDALLIGRHGEGILALSWAQEPAGGEIDVMVGGVKLTGILSKGGGEMGGSRLEMESKETPSIGGGETAIRGAGGGAGRLTGSSGFGMGGGAGAGLSSTIGFELLRVERLASPLVPAVETFS